MHERSHCTPIEVTHSVVKHAGAHYQLKITGDGAGFDAATVVPDKMGLQTMRERAEKFGGSIMLQSARHWHRGVR